MSTTCQLSMTGGMATGNKTKLQIPLLFAPLFDHISLPASLYGPEERAPPLNELNHNLEVSDWWRQSNHLYRK